MKMNEQEQNRWIAEKVMDATEDGGGYLCIDGRLIVGWWNPHGDLNHAEKALAKWCADIGGDCRIYFDGATYEVTVDNMDESYYRETKSLSAAITEALCMATGGVV